MKPAGENIQCVTFADRCRLGQFLGSQDSRAWGDRSGRDKLEDVLEQAESVEAKVTPSNLVTMNTTVTLADIFSTERQTVTLVYPDDVDLVSDGISILAPLGTALLGYKVGDVIQCPVEESQHPFRIEEIVYQPEHEGAFHL